MKQWSDERNEYAQLEGDLLEADASDNAHDVFLYSDLMNRLETNRRVRSAWRFGVPLPKKPKKYEGSFEWDWCPSLNEHQLTQEGHKLLRREIAIERELRHKPWLSWGAILIAGLSLLVSLAVAIWK